MTLLFARTDREGEWVGMSVIEMCLYGRKAKRGAATPVACAAI